jgi:hypothetical protein
MGGRCTGCGRLSLCITMVLCLLLAHTSADTAPATAVATPPTRDQSALLTLFVDDGAHGETEDIVRDKDILVSVAALEKAGIHSFGGTREVVNGKQMVSLVSLRRPSPISSTIGTSLSEFLPASTCWQLMTSIWNAKASRSRIPSGYQRVLQLLIHTRQSFRLEWLLRGRHQL